MSDFFATIFRRDHMRDGTRRAALAIVENASIENQRAVNRLTEALTAKPDRMRATIREVLDKNDRARKRG